MIRFTRGCRVWARSVPTDLRKGFGGLAALVESELGHDLLQGDLFLFLSQDRRMLKILAWDGTGLVVVGKRLARGRYAKIWRHRQGERIELTVAVLHELLQGSDITIADGWRKSR